MKVTVITAVYNGRRQIENTLRSVQSQDHPQLEHIIVDGGSSDGTVDVVRRHGGRVSRIISEADRGPYDAFNKGLRAATGDVIAFLGCGDTYCSQATVSRVAREFDDILVGAVFGDVLIVAERDEEKVLRRFSSKRFSPARMAYGFMPAHPTLFLRRAVYSAAGEYSVDYKIASDFEMCLRVFGRLSTNYVYIPEVLVRMRSGGLSNSGLKSKMAITREMQLACAANGISTSWLKLSTRLPFKVLEMLSV